MFIGKIDKMIEKDYFVSGCNPESTVFFGEIHQISAGTLENLIRKFSDFVGVEIKDIELYENSLECRRLENSEGEEPGEYEFEQWKRGKLTLYCADYHLYIYKQAEISKEELEEDLCYLKDNF